jgi:hypothetical protein
MIRAPRTIPDYDELFEPIRAARQDASGNQLGDPARAAVALLRILEAPDPPGPPGPWIRRPAPARAGRAAVDRDLDTWKDLTLSTDDTSADAP